MTTTNDVTGDRITTKATQDKKYRDNFDAIFRKKPEKVTEKGSCGNCDKCKCDK